MDNDRARGPLLGLAMAVCWYVVWLEQNLNRVILAAELARKCRSRDREPIGENVHKGVDGEGGVHGWWGCPE